jgi:putative membrane protein
MFEFHQNKFNWTSMKLRLWNEVATLFLVSIVFIVVLKDSFNWIKGVLGFFGVAILLMIGIQWYKRLRKSN